MLNYNSAAAKQKNYNTINIILAFVATFFVYANFYTTFTVLPLYVLELGGTEFHSGLHNTLFFVIAVLLRFYFGPLADKKGRKTPLLIGAFAFATSSLFFLVSNNLWTLGLARIYQGIGLAAYFSNGSSVVADNAPKERLGTLMGAYRLMITLSLLVGPYTAHMILTAAGYNVWFIVNFFIAFLGFCLIIFIKSPVAKTPANESTSIDHMLEVIRNKKLWPIYLGIAAISLSYGSILSFITIFISKVTNITNPAIYFSYFAFASVFANIVAGYLSDHFGRPTVVWPSVLSVGLGVTSLYFLPEIPAILYISSSLTGIGFAGGLAVSIAWLVEVADKEFRASVLALQESAIDGSVAVGSLVLSFLISLVGFTASFAVSGLVISIFSIIMFFKTKNKG